MKKILLILSLFVSVVGFSQKFYPVIRNDSLFISWEVTPGNFIEKYCPTDGTVEIPFAVHWFTQDTMRKNFYDSIKLLISRNTSGIGRDIMNKNPPSENSVPVGTPGGSFIWRNSAQFIDDLGAAPLNSPAFTGTPTFPNGVITNNNLAGSIDLTTKVTGTLPFINGGISGAVATSATTGAMTVNMTSRIITITPTGACTFNGSGGVTGQITTFIISTSGTSSFVLTWGTNFRKAGTLATGTTSARFFSVSFICINGTTWQEISRTAAQQ